MFEWLKINYYKYKKKAQIYHNSKMFYKSKKHALIALSYWQKCKEESDILIHIFGTSVYVKLGK